MRSLITGGAGFIGLHLARALADEGHEVTIVDNFARGARDAEFLALLSMPGVRFIEADLTDAGAYSALGSGFDEVYHLAAINGTGNFYERPVEVFRVAMLTTIHVADWFYKQNNNGRLLFSSTPEAYASSVDRGVAPVPTPEEVPLMIADPRNPRASYDSAKLAGEVLLHAYGTKHKMPYVIIRYHNVYGPRMGFEHVIPQFCERIVQRMDPFPIFGAENTRAFCYVDDAVAGTIAAMRSPQTLGETVHIGTDREMTISALAEELFLVAGWRPSAIDIKPAPQGSVLRRAPDVSKLNRLTGFSARTPLDEGLRKIFAWYEKFWKEKKIESSLL